MKKSFNQDNLSRKQSFHQTSSINNVTTKQISVSTIHIFSNQPNRNIQQNRSQIIKSPKQQNYAYDMKYKTEQCRNWMSKGKCKYGKKVIPIPFNTKFQQCRFSHGKKELRTKKHLHKKAKTKPCASFHLKGTCPFGIRCQFLHDEIIVVNKETLEDFILQPREQYFKKYSRWGNQYLKTISYESKLKRLEEEYISMNGRIQKMFQNFHKKWINQTNRLPVFKKITAENKENKESEHSNYKLMNYNKQMNYSQQMNNSQQMNYNTILNYNLSNNFQTNQNQFPYYYLQFHQ